MLIVAIVVLGLTFVAVSIFAVKQWTKRKKAESDSEMERLRLTGSTYKDVKKRYLK